MKRWGIIIDFYQRVFKIYTLEFLNDEFDYIENSFSQFHYTKSFIQHAKIKALKIHKQKGSAVI